MTPGCPAAPSVTESPYTEDRMWPGADAERAHVGALRQIDVSSRSPTSIDGAAGKERCHMAAAVDGGDVEGIAESVEERARAIDIT